MEKLIKFRKILSTLLILHGFTSSTKSERYLKCPNANNLKVNFTTKIQVVYENHVKQVD